MPRYYVQQSRDAPGWKTVATAPSRLSALSLSGSLQKTVNDEQGPNKRYVRAMSRSALLREGGEDACTYAEVDLGGLELKRATLRMRG